MTEAQQSEVKQEAKPIPFSEFLESIPPSTLTDISILTETTPRIHSDDVYTLLTPEIQLHCSDDSCNGTRFFRCRTSRPSVQNDGFSFLYLTYICSNCRKTEKTFSLAVRRDETTDAGRCYKFGELPGYGPPTPAKLIKLIGPDRDL